MKEFINPKSMLTPGVAGSLVMFLVNGISVQFPEIQLRYLALILSFLIGAVVWFSETGGKTPIVQKAVYWVLNSLVIFVVGFGTASLAADATAGAPNAGAPHGSLMPFVSTAYAEQGETGSASTEGEAAVEAPSGSQGNESMSEELERQREENERLREQLERERTERKKDEESEKQFFKRW